MEIPRDFETDGSTLPRFISHWNVGVVYQAGVRHDYCAFLKKNSLYCYFIYLESISPLLKTRRFYRFPLLALGLAVYEISPNFLKKYWRSLAN